MTANDLSSVPSLQRIVRRYVSQCIANAHTAVIVMRSNAHATLAMTETTEADVWNELVRIEEVCREMEEYLREMRLAWVQEVRELAPLPPLPTP